MSTIKFNILDSQAGGAIAVNQNLQFISAKGLDSAGTYLPLLVGGTEKARVTSTGFRVSGNLLMGHTATLEFAGSVTPDLQMLGNDADGSSVGIARFSADANGARLDLGKSRNGTIGSHTIVQDGDELGGLGFRASDGSDFQALPAQIVGLVHDPSPAANQIGGALAFKTNTTTGSLLERARIDNAGNLLLGVTAAGASAAGVLTLGNGTQGAALANAIQIVSEDLSAGNTIPSIRTEGTGIVGTGTPTQDRTVAIKINGTVIYLLGATVAS